MITLRNFSMIDVFIFLIGINLNTTFSQEFRIAVLPFQDSSIESEYENFVLFEAIKNEAKRSQSVVRASSP